MRTARVWFPAGAQGQQSYRVEVMVLVKLPWYTEETGVAELVVVGAATQHRKIHLLSALCASGRGKETNKSKSSMTRNK